MPPGLVDQLIGAHIQVRRRKLAMTASHLAARLDLAELDVIAYERGRRRFSAAVVVKFAAALDCSVIALLNEPSVPPPRPAA